ncbi:hypothetical protein FISHEDRAFT_74227 [Fistulina hepatica ATCC 64428]|uniref:Uncharacterized protein n=1 Tax=Fistulina hepatica ATCC 64428 TaxID=1128425 RepID=A0A0D7AA69_9AGAR|nr:hypothetical protein FISHEDRAFT_74227 [Fistulina hepatica ATCC 64428]
MVATKPTYKERVLRAASIIQREHRKRDIHLASLRAQIRKTAEETSDVLGPRWASWTMKAIEKLTEEGLLTSNEAGTVSLTTTGKKAIGEARKSFGIPADASPMKDISVWKAVASLNTRRARRTSMGSVAGVQVNSSVKDKTPARKRRRTTMGGRGDDLQRLTKFQLIEELRKSQKTQKVVREESPLTELSEDEDVDLQQQQQTQHDTFFAPADNNGRGVSAFTEQSPFQADVFAATPQNVDHGSISSIRARDPVGVVRTASGTLISHISKQPTPAPSEFDTDTLHHDDDDQDIYMSADADDSRMGLATPQSSPTGPRMARRSAAAADFQLNTALRMAAQQRTAGAAAQIDSLTKQLKERRTELGQLQYQITALKQTAEQLAQEKAAVSQEVMLKDASLAEKDVQLSQTANALAEKQAELESKTAELATKAVEITSLNGRIDGCTIAMQTYEAEVNRLKDTLAERQSTCARLQGQIIARDRQTDDLTRDVARLEKAVSVLERDRDAIRAALQAKQGELAGVSSDKDALSRDLASVQATLETVQERAQSSTANVAMHERTIIGLRAELDHTASEKIAREAELQVLIDQAQLAHEQEAVSLRGVLTQKDAVIRANEQDIAAARGEVERLGLETDRLNKALGEARAARRSLESSVVEHTARIAELARAKDVAETALTSLRGESNRRKERIKTLEQDLSARSSALASAVAERAAMSAQLSNKEAALMQKTADVARLEEELGMATEQMKMAEDQNDELHAVELQLREDKATDAQLIARLRGIIERVKARRQEELADLDMGEAQISSSIPENMISAA